MPDDLPYSLDSFVSPNVRFLNPPEYVASLKGSLQGMLAFVSASGQVKLRSTLQPARQKNLCYAETCVDLHNFQG